MSERTKRRRKSHQPPRDLSTRAAREQVLLENLALVQYWAKRWSRPGLERADLFQAGALALWKALLDYNPERGSLKGYIGAAVRHGILHYIHAEERERRRQERYAELLGLLLRRHGIGG